jgi:hypothetical protein
MPPTESVPSWELHGVVCETPPVIVSVSLIETPVVFRGLISSKLTAQCQRLEVSKMIKAYSIHSSKVFKNLLWPPEFFSDYKENDPTTSKVVPKYGAVV